jgi:hypothetical protein
LHSVSLPARAATLRAGAPAVRQQRLLSVARLQPALRRASMAARAALSLAPPRRLVRLVRRQVTAAAAAEGAAEGTARVRPALRRSPRAAVPAGDRTSALRTVVCGDAVAWLEQRAELPCVVTSLPDVSELQGPPLYISSAAQYKQWFRATVKTIVSKLAKGSVAVFYQASSTAARASPRACTDASSTLRRRRLSATANS